MNVRRVIQVSLIAAALAWGGYSLTFHAQALNDVNSVSHASSDVEDEYADLPKGVARSVQSIVAVQRITSTVAEDNAIVASGVILNDHQVLTAGHTASNSKGALSCAGTRVNAQGFLSSSAASSNPVSYASALHSGAADMAVLTVEPDENYQSLPAISVASVLPKPGDVVYFINYQPQADGTIRDPLSAGVGGPVIFSGIVIGHDAQGLQIATGGGTSYGHGQPETVLRKGASGGAIVNGNGELVGLSVSSQSLAANRTPQYIGTNYGITVPEGKYQIANAQTVSLQLLTKLQSNMSACK
jgi:hypothetical protein